MERTIRHPLLGEVTLAQTARARRITLSVRSGGRLRLSYPCGVPHERALAFLEEKAAWAAAARERLAARQPVARRLSDEEIEALRRAAKAELPRRVEELARRFGFRYGRVTIRAARSKWGSCSGQNNLSLSLFLMQLPPRLRDYVILHELCHTVHHNHSPRFHALVDRCLDGHEKALNRELRSYTIQG